MEIDKDGTRGRSMIIWLMISLSTVWLYFFDRTGGEGPY
jgi:hypothetical protein